MSPLVGLLNCRMRALFLTQCHGVLPAELDHNVCISLIEHQENQIEELKSELHSAQIKLYKKEAELQALKDCALNSLYQPYQASILASIHLRLYRVCM